MTEPIGELSPRHLAEHLGDAWRLDRPLVAGFRIFDAYRHAQRHAVLLELVDARKRLRIEISPAPTQHRAASAAGLTLHWVAPAPADAGNAVCRRLAQALTHRLGPGPPRWRVPPASVRLLPDALRDELRWEPARLRDDPDHALLERDAHHYTRLYGIPSAARRVQAVEGKGISVHHPRPRNGALPPSGALYPGASQVVHRRRMRTYFASLGCLFDDDDVPRTVPTPTTLNHALADHPGLARIRPRMLPLRIASQGARAWSRWLLEHTLPVSVAPRWAVEVMRILRRTRRLQRLSIDVGMLAHDTSLHALGFHAIPADAWDTLVRRAAAAHRRHPASVAEFFEQTLTRTCWDVWKSLDEPQAFASAFESHYDELLRAVDELGRRR